MRIFYARVSTTGQHPERQEILAPTDVERTYIDRLSGKDTNRPQLQAMLDYIREGDTVIVESFDRLARNTRDLLSIVDTISGKGAELISIKEQVDTATPAGRLMLSVFGALAEFERATLLERQREGIALAKERGTYKGRKPLDVPAKLWNDVIKLWQAGSITAVEAQKRLNMSPSTFYRRAKKGIV